MKFINNIINKLDNYFSANENKIINELRYELSDKNDIIKYTDKTINTLQQELINMNSQLITTNLILLELKKQRIIPFNKLFKEKKTKYTWKPGKRIYLHNSLENFSNNTEYQEKYLLFLKELGLKDSYKNIDDAVYKIVLMIQKYINNTLDDDYETDLKNFKSNEYWLSPKEAFDYYVINLKAGDCFAGYEEIYTKNGLKKIEDIEVGNEVLSYDFETNKYVYKKVIKHWDKGNLKVNRIHFRNGQILDVSENHPMWHRINKTGKSQYEKQYLSKIDLNNWFKRKIPIVKKLPYTKSKPIWNKKLYRVIGHYLAEGFTDKNKWSVDSSGYELIEYIIPILEKHNIPFTEYKNNFGVPCIRFLKSNFKDYLKPLKENSFNINLSEEILTLPEEYLKELLYGMWLGDGTKKIVNITENSQRDWIYSTSSKKLAEDIQRIGLQLGDSYHIWKQENHQGVGDKPIYRITHNPNSCFLRDFGNDGISEVSISFIEKLNKTQMFDLTVEDTHTVIMKNGIITHQCEDTSALLYGAIVSGLKYLGYDFENRLLRIDINFPVGHAVVSYQKSNGVWACIESTYGESRFSKNWVRDKDMFKGVYTGLWHIFDERTEYELIHPYQRK